MITSNGFIEYISEKELEGFFKISKKILNKNGIFVINSRNRLFNVFSFNEYTLDEIKNNTILQLLEECIEFNLSSKFSELKKLRKISKISSNLKKHKKTGVDVETRFQYTPFQIMEMLRKNHFDILDIHPIHIHIFSTGISATIYGFHDRISNIIQKNKNLSLQLIPQSSSFTITARKK